MEIPAIHGIFLYLLITGIACLLAGAWLICRGWFARRRGQTPHCRRCNYILTGISADRCPECGTTLGPRTIRAGERRRRPILGSSGLLLVLLGLGITTATLTPRVRNIDWYKHRPTSWVITDLRSADPRTQSRAWDLLRERMDAGTFDERQRGALEDELSRLGGLRDQLARDSFFYLIKRYKQLSPANQQALYQRALASFLRGDDQWIYELRMSQNLSAALEQELTELAVTEFEAPQPSGAHAVLMDLLREQALTAALSEKQRQRVFSHIDATLQVRPIGILGQALPCKIGIREAESNWNSTFEVSEVRLDGQSTSAFRDAPVAYGELSGRSLLIDFNQPGSHTLEVFGRVNLFGIHLETGKPASSTPWIRDVHLTARFEAFSADASEGVAWLENPFLSERLKKHISIDDLRQINNGQRCVLPVTLSDLPADISFQIIARFGHSEITIGEIAGVEGESSTHGIYNDNPLRNLAVDRVDIVLRSNAHPALQKLDVLRPWKGTLVYPNVAVVMQNH